VHAHVNTSCECCTGPEGRLMAATKHRAPEEQISEDEVVALLREHGFEKDRLLQVLDRAESLARARRARLEHFWEQGRRRKELESQLAQGTPNPQPRHSEVKAVDDGAAHSRHSRDQPKASLQHKVAQAMQPYQFLNGQSQMRRGEVVGAEAAGDDMDEEQAAQVLRSCGFSTGMIDRWLREGCLVREAGRARIQRYHAQHHRDRRQSTISAAARGDPAVAGHGMTQSTRHEPCEGKWSSPDSSKSGGRRHQVVEIPADYGGPSSPQSYASESEFLDSTTAKAVPYRPAGPDAVKGAAHSPRPASDASLPPPRPYSKENARQSLEREKQRLRAERDRALYMLRESSLECRIGAQDQQIAPTARAV